MKMKEKWWKVSYGGVQPTKGKRKKMKFFYKNEFIRFVLFKNICLNLIGLITLLHHA